MHFKKNIEFTQFDSESYSKSNDFVREITKNEKDEIENKINSKYNKKKTCALVVGIFANLLLQTFLLIPLIIIGDFNAYRELIKVAFTFDNNFKTLFFEFFNSESIKDKKSLIALVELVFSITVIIYIYCIYSKSCNQNANQEIEQEIRKGPVIASTFLDQFTTSEVNLVQAIKSQI